MATLRHSVYDTDTHFSINPITRVLQNEGMGKTRLIQYDHNSERFTFEVPRYIEGHDMSTCNVIWVNYNNIDSQTKQQSKGCYKVDDMQISPNDENVVILSWLISSNATKFVGSLNFLIRFCCADDERSVCYAWNTAIYSNISVSSGIENGEYIAEEYPDILAQWQSEIEKAITGIDDAIRDEVADAITDESVVEAVADAVDNGTIGNFITRIKTTDGTPLRIFVGTNAAYDALEDKQNLFAIITDDTTKENIQKQITSIISGSTSVGYATNAGKATLDGNGKNIANTYLPKSGGTITGNLTVQGALNATVQNVSNVTSKINGKDITNIFESDGVTAKSASEASEANHAISADLAQQAMADLDNLSFTDYYFRVQPEVQYTPNGSPIQINEAGMYHFRVGYGFATFDLGLFYIPGFIQGSAEICQKSMPQNAGLNDETTNVLTLLYSVGDGTLTTSIFVDGQEVVNDDVTLYVRKFV